MTSQTHDLAALTALNLCIVILTVPSMSIATAFVAVCACFIGGLIADLDKPTAKIWDKLPAGNLLGRALQPFLGAHRHLSHSAVGLVLFGLAASYILNLISPVLLVDITIVWWAFMIGLISHIIMDLLTSEGVPLLFPIDIHFGIPPIKFLRMKTGSFWERYLVKPGLIVANAYLLFANLDRYVQFFHSLGK
ncbi:metal-dependent hydrolase [Candidatus Beckwithbacteria bacterium]|nr:metal-dependent hydrolase [Candidatus Beckwithbacteria bacterium]